MREFLYSKWFFGFLALDCTFDLIVDVVEYLHGCYTLNLVSIPLDVIAVFLTGWMFFDLRGRHPKYGGNPPSGR
jgi:hypothetical protein